MTSFPFPRHFMSTPHIMRTFLILLCLVFSGCGSDRAQVAADQHARMDAAKSLLESAIKALPVPAPETQANIESAAILIHNADLSLEATAEMEQAKWPLPKVSAEDLAKHPEMDKPSKFTAWKLAAGLITTGLGLLWTVGRVAPAVPGLGPVVGGLADLAWKFLANRDQKQTDRIKDTIHDYAPELQKAVAIAQRTTSLNVPAPLVAAVDALAKDS